LDKNPKIKNAQKKQGIEELGLVQKQRILGNSGGSEGGHRWTVGGIEVDRGRVG